MASWRFTRDDGSTVDKVRSRQGFFVGTDDLDEVIKIDSDGMVYIPTGSPDVATAADGILTFDGVVNSGETITIGEDVYEFTLGGGVATDVIEVDLSGGTNVEATGSITVLGMPLEGETITVDDFVLEFDTDGVVESGNVAIDLSGGTTAFADQRLEITDAVADGETIVIGADTYEIDVDGDGVASGNIAIYMDAEGAADKSVSVFIIASAINGNPDSPVTAAATSGTHGRIVVTAKHGGAAVHEAEDAEIVLDETLNNGGWDAGFLTGGVDATPEEIRTALVALNATVTTVTITADGVDATIADLEAVVDGSPGNDIVLETTAPEADIELSGATLEDGYDATDIEAATLFEAEVDSELYGATRNDGVVTITASTPHEAGNDIELETTGENITASGDGTLTGGLDGDPCTEGMIYQDEDFIYSCFETCTDGSGWKRVAIA